MKQILFLSVLLVNFFPAMKNGHLILFNTTMVSAQCGSSTGEEQQTQGGISLDWGSNEFDYSSIEIKNGASSDPYVLANDVYQYLNKNSPPSLPGFIVQATPGGQLRIQNMSTGEAWLSSPEVLKRALDHLESSRSNVVNTTQYKENWRRQNCPEQYPSDPAYDPWADPNNPLLSQNIEDGRYDLVYGSIWQLNLHQYLPIPPAVDVSQVDNGTYIFEVPPGAPHVNPIDIARTTDRGGPSSEDMTYGMNGDATDIQPASLITAPEEDLWSEMTSLLHFMTLADPSAGPLADEFIANFRSTSKESPFERPFLNEKVRKSEALIDFCKLFSKDLNNRLFAAGGDINNVIPWTITNYRPIFDGNYNKVNGLQILINDTQETRIVVENYRQLGGTSWVADVTLVIRDHFGLDKTDALKYQWIPFYGSGFSAWWLLQHTRGYRPFETRIVVSKRIYHP